MEILKINSKNFKAAVNKAAKAIKEGKVIVGPSDTVYGLYCDAKNKEAVEKIFKIKNRPPSKPLAIFIKDIKMARKFAKIKKKEEVFLQKVWPGKVTVVFQAKKELPYISFQKTIGIRIPKLKLILSLIKKINSPLAQTSANISGKPATRKIKKVINYFQKQKWQPDLVLDAGNLRPSKPSRIIDLSKKKPKILRK